MIIRVSKHQFNTDSWDFLGALEEAVDLFNILYLPPPNNAKIPYLK